MSIGCGIKEGVLPSFRVKKAAHCIELAEVKSENLHVVCPLGFGVEFCDSGCLRQPKITGLSRQILFEWLPPQTQDLHGFFLHSKCFAILPLGLRSTRSSALQRLPSCSLGTLSRTCDLTVNPL